ncbi:MAG: nucleotide sugar dehydrogenase [Methanomassiliicoccales archaeon]|nr:nucleotide sugar dehydrogenase [Methanomassiliicoccales archaeon]
MSDMLTVLAEKIKKKTAKISIIGLGYVGLNVSVSFAYEGFRVYGFDDDWDKIESLERGENYIPEERYLARMLPKVLGKKFFPSREVDKASEIGDVIIIIVPTANGDIPTLKYLNKALASIAKNDISGKLIVLESTVKVGTTNEIVIPRLEKDGLIAGEDFLVAYSPERIDPGNPDKTLKCIPKIVSGVNKEASEIAAELYETIVDKVVLVSSIRTAEFIKLMENSQRDVNIALMNLFALMCEKADIDIEEALFAAATKWNFHAYKASCGVGGHCLKKDPLLLMKSFENTGLDLGLIESTRIMNDSMPVITAEKAAFICKTKLKEDILDVKIGILGLSYKKNSSDDRNAPAGFIIEHLRSLGAKKISFYDPLIRNTSKNGSLKEVLSSDIIILTVAHDKFKGVLENYEGYIIDGTNTLEPSDRVAGIGRQFAGAESGEQYEAEDAEKSKSLANHRSQEPTAH